MQFRIADTFTESLGKLNGEEQRTGRRRGSICNSIRRSRDGSFEEKTCRTSERFDVPRVPARPMTV